jgi:hypothetical protein
MCCVLVITRILNQMEMATRYSHQGQYYHLSSCRSCQASLGSRKYIGFKSLMAILLINSHSLLNFLLLFTKVSPLFYINEVFKGFLIFHRLSFPFNHIFHRLSFPFNYLISRILRLPKNSKSHRIHHLINDQHT